LVFLCFYHDFTGLGGPKDGATFFFKNSCEKQKQWKTFQM
jgi:hypothetical protein